MNQYKTCSKCKQHLDISNYGKDLQRKDGLKTVCRTCRSFESKQRRAANPDYDRLRYLANQESFKAEARKRYWNNPDETKAKVRDRRKQNPNRQKALDRKYYLNSRESKIASAVKRAKLFPEIATQRNNRRKALKLNNGVFEILEKELRKLRANPCYHCGRKTDITLDHRIPLIRGGTHSIGNLLPLCKYCNSSKKEKTYMEFRMMLKRRNV